MDKDTFDKEVYQALSNFGLAAYFSLWQSARRERLRQFDSTVPSIDYHLIAVINSPGPNKAGIEEIEKIVPGFKERLRQYGELQARLLHDLARVNKEIVKEVLPFREWLQNL